MKTILAATTAIALVTPARAAPPDQIYEFTVISDTIEPLRCSSIPPPAPDQCETTEGPVPYKFATLNLTHEALTSHEAQWVHHVCDATDKIDDGHVISLVMSSPSYGPNIPNTLGGLCDVSGWDFDLTIRGNHISGSINSVVAGIGASGCFLKMSGSNNNWAGTWRCGSPKDPNSVFHSFTATSRRVEGQAHVSQ
jgi:hypothetical protein